MSHAIEQERFASAFFELLDEAFETHHGIFLDKGTSLFPTLEPITAEQASRSAGGTCATLAAQVAHVIFYLDVLERYVGTRKAERVDWREIWNRVRTVTPEEWAALERDLDRAYRNTLATLRAVETWNDADTLGGALAIVVHTAYHLGGIRQALCAMK